MLAVLKWEIPDRAKKKLPQGLAGVELAPILFLQGAMPTAFGWACEALAPTSFTAPTTGSDNALSAMLLGPVGWAYAAHAHSKCSGHGTQLQPVGQDSDL